MRSSRYLRSVAPVLDAGAAGAGGAGFEPKPTMPPHPMLPLPHETVPSIVMRNAILFIALRVAGRGDTSPDSARRAPGTRRRAWAIRDPTEFSSAERRALLAPRGRDMSWR